MTRSCKVSRHDPNYSQISTQNWSDWGVVDKGLLPPDMSGCTTIQDILSICNVTYLTEGLTSLIQIESDSVDLVFSQAVLEHIRGEE